MLWEVIWKNGFPSDRDPQYLLSPQQPRQRIELKAEDIPAKIVPPSPFVILTMESADRRELNTFMLLKFFWPGTNTQCEGF